MTEPPATEEEFWALPVAGREARYLGEAFVKPLGSIRYMQDADGDWWGIERLNGVYCRRLVAS